MSVAGSPTRPAFLTDHAPGRGLRRLTPWSRVPATGRYGEVWHVAAERNPSQEIVLQRPPDIATDGRTTYSFAEWAALVDEATGWLHAAGVRPWDCVVIMKANHPDITVLGSATARIGAIPAQMASNHSPEVVHTLLERLEKPFLITDTTSLQSGGLDEETLRRLTRATICIDGGRPGLIALDSLRGAQPAPPEMRAMDEPMVITHTSGTTGVPKLAMHSGETMHALTHVETERWPLLAGRRSDVIAFCDPWFHQRVVTAMFALATITPKLLALSEPSEDSIADLLAEHSPTVVETLPNIYLTWERLARDPRPLFANVRLFINSFDAIHTRTIRTFLEASRRRVPVWIQSWSQTENGVLVMRPYTRLLVRRRGQRPPPTQRLGWPLPGVAKVRASNPLTGLPVKAGEVGLIEIRQPGRCLAYVGEQHRHENKCDGLWWNTGDLGIISRLGSVRLIDREVDRIQGASGLELEDVLLDRLPHTTEVVVLSRPDALPVPVISTEDEVGVSPEAWSQATRDLPALAPPVHLRWDEFPRTATWKIRRVALREQLFGEGPVGRGEWT